MTMFVSSNSFMPNNVTRPPFVKIEELNLDSSQEKIFYSTEVDNFDSILYEKCLKSQNKPMKEKSKTDSVPVFKYANSQVLYDLDYDSIHHVEKFDILSNRKPFASVPGMGNITLRSKYKLQMAKTYRNERRKDLKSNFEFLMNDDHSQNKNSSKRKSLSHKRRKNSPASSNNNEDGINSSLSLYDKVVPSEKEQMFFESALIRRGMFKPTHGMKTELSHSRVSVDIKDNLNSLLKVNDSLYNSCFDDKLNRKAPMPSRPRYVEELFRKYDYQELDPWKKIQNRTKDKSLCLSVIKEVYYKICSFFY